MTRLSALLGSGLFLLIAPGTLAGLIPWSWTDWRLPEPLSPALAVPGALLILFGAAVLLECFWRFSWTGLGTPAPVAPPQSLVVSGFYRHVRNPMYVAVTSLIFGQALLFARPALAVYGAIIWGCFHLFVLGYEEPTLRQRHGESYEAFVRNVPRWIPRLTAWRGSP